MANTKTLLDIFSSVWDGGSALNVNSGGSSSYATQIDEASDTITYVGKALTGTPTSAASWQIQRITTSGSSTAIAWANGTATFDNTWDDRASLSYS